jgi:exopolysaccharide biosynthesis predicted pyruvyltransferase EpsI
MITLLGDHMLTVGEQTFLQRSGWNNSILECEYVQSAKRVPLCTKSIKEMSKLARVALWHAGGNWGDLWIRAQRARIDSFSELLLAGLSIVGMPQSLYYKNQMLKALHTTEMKHNIMLGLNLTELESFESRAVTRSRLTFTWREQRSYDQAKAMYPFATNKLVPDIAFQLGPFEPIRPENYEDLVDIVVFLRNDTESVYAKERNRGSVQQYLNNIPGGMGLTFTIVDWKDRLKIFGTTNENFDQTSVRLMSMGKIVICDRLHASILSYISGVPFVYVDQVSNKLTNTLSVAFSSWEGCQNEHGSMLTRATSLQDALQKSVEFLDEHDLI